jgi:PhoPQ-activated pathogenicity-related protein
MSIFRFSSLLLCALPLSVARADSSRILASPPTALDRYVAEKDDQFAWKVVSQVPVAGGKFTVIELTSQQWLTDKEVDKPVWKHWLKVLTPDKVENTTGLLMIGGGNNTRPAPEKADSNLTMIALAAKSVVAELTNVPSQPLVFVGDGKPRVEDDIIAYCWDKFLRTGDERWPTRLPMTKAAVRALDAMTAFSATEQGGNNKVEKFFVAGASKRGWTTWTTAAVDSRVVGIAPIVIDVLNLAPATAHHWECYGHWAPAIEPYTKIKLAEWAGTPEFKKLAAIEDPWEYRARFTLPKYIINSAGDQFFPCESSHFYYDGLPGPKWLRYVPNTNHSLKGSDAWMSLLAFYNASTTGAKLPELTWTSSGEGKLRVTTKDQPSDVLLWKATNPKARDFRLETLGPVWKSEKLAPAGEGVWEAAMAKPEEGWTGFFIELTFPNPAGFAFKFTTEVRVTPEAKPFKYLAPAGRPQ